MKGGWTLRPLQDGCDLTGRPGKYRLPACKRPACWVLWDPKTFGEGSILFLCDVHARPVRAKFRARLKPAARVAKG